MHDLNKNFEKHFNIILKAIIGKFLAKKLNLEYECDGIDGIEPPYLLFANHTNFYDPFILAYKIPYPVRFVTSDEFFRNPLLRFLLYLVGAIPKTKAMSDSITVKSIIKAKKGKRVIGIFPEGKRNWDGTTLPVLYPTSKLVKNLKIPVVVAVMEGAGLSYPRWANRSRTGKISVRIWKLLDQTQTENMTTDEIHNAIQAAIKHDESQWQKINMIPFGLHSKHLAERLELLLYVCPQCNSIGTLFSKGNIFGCNSCGLKYIYDEYGFFRKEDNGKEVIFDTVRSWNVWQKQFMRSFLTEGSNGIDRPFFQDFSVFVRTGKRLKKLKKFNFGHISLFRDRICFNTLAGEKYSFPLNEINGINTQYNDQFEFYRNGTLYRFAFKFKNISAHKWAESINILKNERVSK